MNNLLKNAILTPFNILYKINPTLDIKILFRLKVGYKLNLKDPKTYNEKIQWIKLNDKNALMPGCCDKYTVRKYVEEHGCGAILNELYWEGFDPAEIPFDSLPHKFVIKVTHGSTFNILCKNKNELNKTKTVKILKKWLNTKFLPCYGEWFYGIEKPRIIIEKYLESDDGEQLKDYKVYCFNGEPKYITLISGRFTDNQYNDTYDINWNLQKNCEFGHQCSNIAVKKPSSLDKLLEYSRILSKDFLHARVDFYIIQNVIYFGEITFTDGAGFEHINPPSFAQELGDCLALPNNINHKLKI